MLRSHSVFTKNATPLQRLWGRTFTTSAPSCSEKDVVIIGAGIMGCATALELQRKGFNTLVLDREAGAAHGSTSFSSGIIRTFYSLEETTKLALEGHHYWANWEEWVRSQTRNDGCDVAEFTPMPSLLLRDVACEDWIQTLINNHRVLNIPMEEWDLEKIKHELPWIDWTNYYPPRRIDDEKFGEPNVKEGDVHGALILPMSGFVADPQLATQNIRWAAEHAGAKFAFKQTVAKIHKNDKRVEGVELEDGTVIKARVVVNAAGPHSNKITEMAYSDGQPNDMKLTTKPMRVEAAYMDVPKGVDFSKANGYIVCDTNLGIYFRPDVCNTMVVGGQEPACDPLHFLDDYNNNDPAFTDEWEHHVYRANLRMPTLGIPNASRAQGVVSAYDVTEDWVPVYDKSNIPGYYMCIGTSGNQFKNAPVVGKAMAKIIEEVEAGRNHDGDEHCWVGLDLSGWGKLDLSVFSRLRDIKSTTATVMG